MNTMIAYCGLNCAECEAYKATQAGDPQALEAVAKKWRELYNPNITAESIPCDGCKSEGGRLVWHCAECKVRSCAREKQVSTCAHCADYDHCDIITEFLKHAPSAKTTLDALRAELQAS